MEVEQVVVRLTADTAQYFASMDYAGARLLGYSAGLVSGIAKHSIQMAAAFEKNSVAVRTMVGDYEEGNKLLADITQLAIDTPFSSEELVGVTKQLKAFGMETSEIIPTLTSLGNISAGTGTEISRIALAFGQVKVAGKLMGTELRQFVDAGVPLMDSLGKVMGKPTESIRSMVEQGRVGFKEVVQAFNLMNAKGGKFAGLMDTISQTTIGGRWQAFKETLDVASRNFALAAIEGLGLKSALDGITKSMSGMGTDQGATIRAFQEVKAVINGIVMVVQKVWEGLSLVTKKVVAWVEENQHLIKYGLLIVGTFWSLYAVIKTITIAFAALRILMTTVYALSGIGALISAAVALVGIIGSMIGMLVGFLAAMTTILGPILLIVGGVVYLLTELGTFKFMGSAFSEGISALGELKSAFKGILAALKSGDLESAWGLITVSFQYAWRVMVLTLKAEWEAFVKGLEQSVGRAIRKQLPGGGSVVDEADKVKAELNRQEQAIKSNQIEFNLSPGSAASLAQWQDIAADLMKKQKDWESSLSVLKMTFPGRPDTRDPLQLDKNIKAHEQEINDLIQARKKADEEMAKILKRGGSPIELEFIKKSNKSMMNDPELVRLKKEIERLNKAAEDKRQQTPGNAGPNSGGLDAQMSVPYGISGQARDVMNRLEKELSKGVTAWDQFTKEIALINEAWKGPQKDREGFQAALGAGFGQLAKLGPMKDDAYYYGLFQAQQKLAKGMDNTPKTAPSALYGSVAAQDSINANMDRRDTVEEEVLRTLLDSKTLHEQQVLYQKAVAEAMMKLDKNGTLKKLSIEQN